MKVLVVRVVIMLITFALGVGVQQLIVRQTTATPRAVAVENGKPQVELTTPAIPIATVNPRTTPTPPIFDHHTDGAFVPDGEYTIIGRKPTQFADLGVLNLSSFPQSGYEGWIGTNNDHESQAVTFGVLTQNRLFFVSLQPSDSGFEYRFDGEFIRTDFDSVSGKNKPVLRGTLTKFKDGQKVASTEVSFQFERLGC
jgi:hypothetical protein